MAESDDSRAEVEKLFHDIGEDVKSLKAWIDDSLASSISRWRLSAGKIVDEMIHDRRVAMNCLNDSRPKVRNAALKVLIHYWQEKSEVRSTCENMAFHDSDSKVRREATFLLGLCYARTQNDRIADRLAKTVKDESQPMSIREAAYWSLYSIHGTTPKKWRALFHSQFPQDVDWEFVEGFVGKS